MKKISLIFAGTSPFGIPSLKALAADQRFSIDLVITQPDRPTGRKQTLTPPPIKAIAKELGLPLWQPENINKEWASRPPNPQSPIPNPQFLIVIAYGQLLTQPILDFPTVAPVNVHGSLLPRWRGASPVQHAILSGDRESGVTVQKMVKELDAGAILSQAKTPLAERETFASLHDRLAELSAPLLLETLTHPLKPMPQDEQEVTVCRKLSREDGKADPAKHTAEDIDRLTRALTPWPGVTVDIEGETLKILETSLTPTPGSTPLSCRDWTILHLVTVQLPGGKPMSGDAWKRGKR